MGDGAKFIEEGFVGWRVFLEGDEGGSSGGSACCSGGHAGLDCTFGR